MAQGLTSAARSASSGYQPIILPTVQRDGIHKVLGLEMGADDYVTNPFELRELLARMGNFDERTVSCRPTIQACSALASGSST